MKPARLAVLAVALLAGGGAAYLMSDSEPPPAPAPQAVAPPKPVTEVLVAAGELSLGQILQAGDMRWQRWPDDGVVPGTYTRQESPQAIEQTVGATVRSAFLPGEPIRPQKLVRPDSGFMAAILPPGQRAVAIVTDSRGTNSAGGFILPNDRVDVIQTARDEERLKAGLADAQVARTILQDVRVLAVGQLIQEKNGTNVVTGETATLALTPAQAETVTLAQKVGSLSLALRSLADAGQVTPEAPKPAEKTGPTVVRFGVSQQQMR